MIGMLPAENAAYDHLAALLLYPGEDCLEIATACAAALRRGAPEAAEIMDKFISEMSGRSVDEMEEAHIRVFDWNPHCALELGWHLFGEDYNRGAFLVRMREELRTLGVEESSELPDHLTHALAALKKMPPERAEDFKRACVLPAVEKIIEGLGRVDRSPYRHILGAIRVFLGGANTSAEDEQ